MPIPIPETAPGRADSASISWANDRLLARRAATPAVLGGPGDRREPGVGELALPRRRSPEAAAAGRVLRQPRLRLGAEGAVVGSASVDLVGYGSHGSV